MSTVCGTPSYLAPEIIKNEKYEASCDIWSLGVILYIVLSGYAPFDEDDHEGMVKKAAAGLIEFPDDEWKEISGEAKDIIKKMMNPNPKARITISQILEHPWMVNNIDKVLDQAKTNLKKYNARRKLRKSQMVVYLTQILSSGSKKKKAT